MHDIKAMDNVCDKNVLMLHKEVNEDAIMLLSAS